MSNRHIFTKDQQSQGGKTSKRGEDTDTKKLRNFISQILGDETKAKAELAKLEGKDYWQVLNNLMNYSLPKLTSAEVEANIKRVDSIRFIDGE